MGWQAHGLTVASAASGGKTSAVTAAAKQASRRTSYKLRAMRPEADDSLRENATPPARQLILALETRVTCPKCASRFSLEQGFARQALEELEHATAGALETLLEDERAEARRHAQQLAAQRAKITQREAELASREQQLEMRVSQEAQAKARTLFAADRQALEQQLAQQTRQIAELRSAELALRREKSSLQDRAAALEIEVARKLDAGRAELEARVRAQERERAELDKAELQKRLEDVNTQLAEAQRKSHQSSQQLQGEVLELTLEAGLEKACPLDVIEEVKKGARGGDIIQHVMTRTGQQAGVLLWEAKRARDWSAQWIGKLKEDMRGCQADIGVLVITGTALPKDWDDGQLFGLHEDVWVTCWTTALQLAAVLRAGLLDMHKQRLISANKGEKMEAVYDYLTSSQFAHKLKAVYGSFYRMRQELEAEKSQTLQRWARREKQLQSGIAELVGVAGDIQGLAQQDLPLLEMGEPAQPEPPAREEAGGAQLGLQMERD